MSVKIEMPPNNAAASSRMLKLAETVSAAMLNLHDEMVRTSRMIATSIESNRVAHAAMFESIMRSLNRRA